LRKGWVGQLDSQSGFYRSVHVARLVNRAAGFTRCKKWTQFAKRWVRHACSLVDFLCLTRMVWTCIPTQGSCPVSRPCSLTTPVAEDAVNACLVRDERVIIDAGEGVGGRCGGGGSCGFDIVMVGFSQSHRVKVWHIMHKRSDSTQHTTLKQRQISQQPRVPLPLLIHWTPTLSGNHCNSYCVGRVDWDGNLVFICEVGVTAGIPLII